MSKWKTVRLGDVATYINGYAFKPSDWSDSGLPIIRIQNLTGNDYETNYYQGNYNVKYEVLPGDILISWSASLGIFEWKKEKALLNQHIFKVVFDKLSVEKSYFVHTVSYLLDEMEKEVHGSTMKHITKPRFDNTPFPYPPIEQQHKIASNLDKVTHTIDICNAILEKLDLLVKSRFVEMFGDVDLTPQKSEWIAVSEIGTVVGGSTPKTSIEEYWDGDLKWITPAELDLDTGYLYDSIRKITKAGAESCSLQLIPINTVILTSRAPIGKVAIAGTEFYCNQGFKNIICKDTINPRYLYSLLLFNTDYLNSLGRGATFKEISKAIVEKIRIPVPPIALQNQFADFVKQVDKSKAAVQKELEKTQMLFDSLMQEYFG